jgi:hypothetical protein
MQIKLDIKTKTNKMMRDKFEKKNQLKKELKEKQIKIKRMRINLIQKTN